MQVPEDWDNVGYIDISTPTENYYILKFINVTEGTSKAGNDLLRIEFDIAEGEFKDFYTMMGIKHQRNLLLQFNQLTQKKSALPYFKTLIKNVEESNDGYEWDFSFPAGLKGKKIGAYLMLEPYINREGIQKEFLKVERLYSVKYVNEKLAAGTADEIKMRKANREIKRREREQRTEFQNQQNETFNDLPWQ